VAGVLSCVARLRGRRPDAVIGFGGGSCLDMAKVVSLLLTARLTAATGADAVARAETMLGALAGGIALGTAGTAAAHALQYPLGALTHTPHGVGVGALLPYVMRFNLHTRVDEFAQIGRALGAPAESDPVAAALAAIITVDELLDAIGIPGNLADLGLPAGAVGQVAELRLGAARLVDNNPRRIDLPAAQSIVQAAYEGDRALPTAAQVRAMLASPQ
jgi:alcohol dehydrogenase